MEDSDRELIGLVAGSELFSLADGGQVVQLASKLQQGDTAMTATRQNFLIDASTPHGDVIITDSSVQKPGIGWVTLHVTESIRSGVHEWAVRVENQGETSDGSGLMLGIVPKNYSRFDSFISQGSGWCLSRAGKFYGHWRRVDDNTSVSSLVFGTGDRVVFELDFDAARMTVRVGDRFVVGEISNLSSEVYPALSLHYRHQHVKFEYHKVHDRHAKRLSWVDRGALSSALTLLPLHPHHARSLPLDSYLYLARCIEAAAAAATSGGSSGGITNGAFALSAPPFAREQEIVARTVVLLRAFAAVQRYIKAGFVQLDEFLPPTVTAMALARSSNAPQRPAFSLSCGSLLMVQVLSHAPLNGGAKASWIVTTSSALLNSLTSQPLFAFAPSVAPEAHIVCRSAIESLRSFVRSFDQSTPTPELHLAPADAAAVVAALELLVVLSCQTGCVGDVLDVVATLMSPTAEKVAASDSRTLSAATRNFVANVWEAVQPPYTFDFAHAKSVADRHLRDLSTEGDTPLPSYLSAAAAGGFLYVHGPRGLAKLGTGLRGTSLRPYATTTQPSASILGCSSSSMAKVEGFLLLHTDTLAAQEHAAVVYTDELVPSRVITAAESGWPRGMPVKLFGDGTRAFLAMQRSSGAAATGSGLPFCADGPVDVLELSVPTFAPRGPPRLLSAAIGGSALGAGEATVIALGRGSSIDFPCPTTGGPHAGGATPMFPDGFMTIELWAKLIGPAEQRTLYQHGDKATSGEIFIETYVTDGALCLRGGCRYEIRGAKIASVQAPLPLGGSPSWHHVALVFDGRWRLLIDGEEGPSAKAGAAQQMCIESPRGRWSVGNGTVAHVMELRVWGTARTVGEIRRDCRRPLAGHEAALLLYCPLTEPNGCVAFDCSRFRRHGWISSAAGGASVASERLRAQYKQDELPIRRRKGDSPFSDAAGGSGEPWLLPSLDICQLACVGDSVVVSHPLEPPPQSAAASSGCTEVFATVVLQLPRVGDISSPAAAPPPPPQVSSAAAATFRGLAAFCATDSVLHFLLPTGQLGHVTLDVLATASLHGAPRGPEELRRCASITPEAAGAVLLSVVDAAARASAGRHDDDESRGAAFRPMAVDVSEACIARGLTLLKDHYRTIQTVRARRTSTLKSDESSPVISCLLRILGRQLSAAAQLKVHPSTLSLAVAAGATSDGATQKSVGAQLQTVLSDIVNDEDPGLPADIVAQAALMLEQLVPLLYPSVPRRAALMKEMLQGQRQRRPAQEALLAGLVASLSTVPAVVGVIRSDTTGREASDMDGEVHAIASLLLEDAVRFTQISLRAIGGLQPPTSATTTAAAAAAAEVSPKPQRVSYKAEALNALGMLQLLLFSRARDDGIDSSAALQSTKMESFSFTAPPPVGRSRVVLEYYRTLLAAAKQLLHLVADVCRRAEQRMSAIQAVVADSLLDKLLLSAVACAPLETNHMTCAALLEGLSGVRAATAEVARATDESRSSGAAAASIRALAARLDATLATSLAWVASFMSTVGADRSLHRPLSSQQDAATSGHDDLHQWLRNRALGGGMATHADVGARIKRAAELSETFTPKRSSAPDALDTAGGPTVAALVDRFVAAVVHLSTEAEVGSFFTGPARRAFRQRLIALKSECSDFDGFLARAIDRLEVLLQLEGRISLAEAALTLMNSSVVVATAPRVPQPSTSRARVLWQRLRTAWRVAMRTGLLREATSVALGWERVAPLVEKIAFEDTCSADTLRRAFCDARDAAQLRVAGVTHILRCAADTHSQDALLAASMFARAPGQRAAITAGVEGCGSKIAAELRHGVHSLVRRFAAASVAEEGLGNAEVTSLLVSLLHRHWEPIDFAFLQSIDAPRLLLRQCSVFDVTAAAPHSGGGSILIPESHAERARRVAARERKRASLQGASPSGQGASGGSDEATKVNGFSPREQLLARSWDAVKELTIECVRHLSNDGLDVVERAGCRGFVAKAMNSVAEELRSCAEYAQQLFAPAHDRISEQVATVCSFVCAVLRCCDGTSWGALTSLCAVAVELARLTRLSASSTASLVGGPPIAELCMRTLGLLCSRATPTQLEGAFDMAALLAAPGVGGSHDGGGGGGVTRSTRSAVAFFHSWALRVGTGVLAGDALSSGAAGRALAVLRHLLLRCPAWQADIVRLLQAELRRAPAMVFVQGTDESKRETATALLVALLVVDGAPAAMPHVGEVMTVGERQCVAGRIETRDEVIVIEHNPAAGTATVIDAALAGPLQSEREVSCDSLLQHTSPLPPCFAVLADDVAAMLRLLLDSWLLANGSLLGAAVCALALRFVSRMADRCSKFVSLLAQRGLLRQLHAGCAQKLVLSPLPLPFLAEYATLALGCHLVTLHNSNATQPLQTASPVATAPSLSSLAMLEHEMEPARVAATPFGALEARSARRRPEVIKPTTSAALLLCDSQAGIRIQPADEWGGGVASVARVAALPSGTSGLTVELIVAAHDRLRSSVGSSVTHWAKTEGRTRLLTLSNAQGVDVCTLDLVGDALVLTAGDTRCSAMLYRTARECGRKVHVTIVVDHAAQLFRDGDLCGVVAVGGSLFTSSAPLAALSCGLVDPFGAEQVPAAATAYVALCGLRLWGAAIQADYLRSIAEIVLAEDVLPTVAMLDAEFVTFRFLEGAGATTLSDDDRFVAHLRGNVRWIPSSLPAVVAESDLRFVDDLPPEQSEPCVVPRREWLEHLSALEPAALVATGYHLFASLSAHYARRCITLAICTAARPHHRLTGGAALAPHDIFGSLRPAHAAGNLLRYCASNAIDITELSAVCEMAVDAVKHPAASSSGGDEPFADFLEAVFALVTAPEETFRLTMQHHGGSSPSSQLHPLLVMHGETFCISFEGLRGMEQLYVFADRVQKVHLAKFPDSQGQWPELELTRASWLFLKPTSSAKGAAGRCTVRSRTMLPFVGERLLQLMLCTGGKIRTAVFNQNFLHSLARFTVGATGERRLIALRCLTATLDNWSDSIRRGDADSGDIFSRCPPYFLVWPLLDSCFAHVRRDAAQGTLSGTPSMTHCRLVQQLAELATAAYRLEAAQGALTSAALYRRHIDAIRLLYKSSTDELSSAWQPGTCAVELQQCPGMTGTVAWRRRSQGTWLATCDRGWQTVRSSVGLTRGRFYFEVRIAHNSSSVCVGLVTKQFRSGEVTTSPLGCDAHSWCYDGSRLCRWHSGVRNEFSNRSKWKARDVIGVFIDLEDGLLSATHNGKMLGVAFENLTTHKSPVRQVYYPAVSFNPSGCEVNFGGSPFVYDVPIGHVGVEPLSAIDSLSTVIRGALVADTADCLAQGGGLPPELRAICSVASVTPKPPAMANGREGLDDVDLLFNDSKPKLEGSCVKAGDTLCVVKGAVAVSAGRWYFETLVQGDGMIQVGWASSTKFSLESCRTRGLGEDPHSWAIDGCRMLARHNKQQRSLGRHPWRDGDIVGCMVDCGEGSIGYTINGHPMRDIHDSSGDGTIFLRVQTAGGMSPVVSIEPNSTATVLFAPDELSFLPEGYAPLGGQRTGLRFLSGLILPQPANNPPTPDPALLAQYQRIAHLTSEIVDFVATPIVSLATIVERIAPHANAPPSSIAARLNELEVLTRLVSATFPFIPLPLAPGDVGSSKSGIREGGPLYRALQTLKSVLLPMAPLQMLLRCLAMTNGPGEAVKLTLNRRKAAARGHLQNEGSAKERLEASVFGQVFSLLGDKPPSLFVTNKKLWSVAFAGEGADDVGGPYRESVAEICAEVMSTRLPLFVPSGNQVSNSGEARDRFVVPSEVHPDARLAMYNFLGRMMAGCLRSGELLSLYLPSSVWKSIVGEPLDDSDLAQVDSNGLQSLRYLEANHDEASDIVEGGFVVTNTDGVEVPLFDGGELIAVTAETVALYVQLIKDFRLNQDGKRIRAAITEGFHRVVPQYMLAQMRWADLERCVCGRPDFSVADLQATVRYEDLRPDDRRVQFLWRVLEGFSRHERALFMRFVSGRERHPLATLRLKLMPSVVPDDTDDQHLPHASTCFFWLSLPNYTSVEVMHDKLLYAISNCHDIDADFRVRDDEAESSQPRAIVRSDHEDDGEFEDYSHLL